MEKNTDQYTKYSHDWKKLIRVPGYVTEFHIKPGTEEISDKAFSDCINLTSVIIPDSVVYIGNGAFKNCINLTTVTIPDSVTHIGEWAFGGCRRLKNVILPNSVTHIGAGAFRTCGALENFNIPKSVTHIGDWAISCKSLKNIYIPNSVTHIGEHAFCETENLLSIQVGKGNKVYDSRDNCNAIIHTATNTLIQGCINTIIPDSVVKIGEKAFYGCKGMFNVFIPDSVTCISDGAFSGIDYISRICVGKGNKIYDSRDDCNAIIHTATNTLILGCRSTMNWRLLESHNTSVPDTVTQIGEGAFSGCQLMVQLSLPESVTYIKSSAFEGCSNLTSVRVFGSLSKIEEYAFAGCSSLSSFKVQGQIQDIEELAFIGCDERLVDDNIPEWALFCDPEDIYEGE